MKHRETAQRLKLALDRKNMKAIDLAEKVGISNSSISVYVNGHNIPSNITAAKLGQVLGVSPAWLMGFDVPMIDKITEPVELPKETALKAKEIYDDPKARILLDAKRMLSADELDALANLIQAMISSKRY